MKANLSNSSESPHWLPIAAGQTFFLVVFVIHWQLKPAYSFLHILDNYIPPMIMEPVGSFFLWGAWIAFAASIVMALFSERFITAVVTAAIMQLAFGVEAGVIAVYGQFHDLKVSYFIEGMLTYTAIFLFVFIPGVCFGFLLRQAKQFIWR